MNYGLPYKGSKNRIAKKILDVLPAAPVLYDVFAGGCAITHAAKDIIQYRRGRQGVNETFRYAVL